MAQLTRDSEGGMIAGVASGLGDYFGVDPVLFRVGFVALALVNGFGLLAYIICWVVIPERSAEEVEGKPRGRSGPGRGRIVVGGLLVLAGLVFLLARLPWLYWPVMDVVEDYWPVAVIAIGVLFVAGGLRGGRRG